MVIGQSFYGVNAICGVGIVLVGNCPVWELSEVGIVLAGNYSGSEFTRVSIVQDGK